MFGVMAALPLQAAPALSASSAAPATLQLFRPSMPPQMSRFQRLSAEQRQAWVGFCAELAASSAAKQAKNALAKPTFPQVTRILKLRGPQQRRWMTFCAALLPKQGVSSRAASRASRSSSSSTAAGATTNAPASASQSSSSSVSSSFSTSSSSATGFKGACVVRNGSTGLPAYNASDAGQGYAKMNKGVSFASYDVIRDSCTQEDYAALAQTFCAQNPGSSYQKQVGMYNQDNSYNTTGTGNFGADFTQCPAASSSSSSQETGYKGACVVRDAYTSLPAYNVADVGQGYAKLNKGSGFASYEAVRDTCSQSDYTALGQSFCAQNPGGSYQMQVAMYNLDNSYNTTGSGNFGSNFVQCGS